MIRFVVKQVGLVLVMQLVGIMPTAGQCPSASELTEKVNAVHANPTFNNSRKIQLLKTLQQQCVKCSTPKDAAYALLLHRLGDIYHKAGSPEQAVYYTKMAVDINASKNSGNDPAFLVNSYFNLGVFYKRLHLPKVSHHYFDRCIALGSRYPDKHFIVFMAFEQKAYACYQTGDYQKSMQIADEGLRFCTELKDLSPRPALLAQRAQAAGEMLLFKEAETNVSEAISLLEKAGNDPLHLATSYSVYAALLSKTHKPKAAIDYYRKAFELNKINGNFEQSSRDVQDMGCVYADELKQGNTALVCYRQGIELAKVTGDLYQLSALYSNIGVVYANAKDYDRALRYYQKALNTLPLNFLDTALNSNPGKQLLKLVANDYFMVAILANKGGALLERYKQRANRNDLELALATFELADQALDMMRWKQSGTLSKLVWRQKTREMYAQCIEVCYQLKSIDKAYYFFEKSRAALLNDQLHQATAEGVLAAFDRKKEQQLRIKADVLSEQLLGAKPGKAGYAVLKQGWVQAQENWEGFIKTLEQKYPVYYQYKYDMSVYPYDEIKRKLGKDEVSFVSYFRGDKMLYALLLSAGRQRLVKINYPFYEKDTKAMLKLCAHPSVLNQHFNAYKKIAFRLYRNLFAHFDIPEGRVIVSQDGHFIPFDALLSDTASSHAYLAEKYIFSYAHTLRALVKNKSFQQVSPDFLGVAPLNFASAPGLATLKGSDVSLKQLSGNFKHASLLISGAASKAAFLENAKLYGLVQIYAHANAKSYDDLAGKINEPVLYLADSAVYLSDIQKIHFNCTQLVVLSACNTGIGNQVSGEGVFSLARGFMAAGIPASITNLWQVDDQVTYKLTESFYTYLQEGLPKDVALNKAKLNIMADEDQLHALPYYWAATVLIGDAGTIYAQSYGPYICWIAGSLLIVGLMLFFWFKVKKSKKIR